MKPILWNKVSLTLGIFSVAMLAIAGENAMSTNQPPSMLTSQQFVSDAAMGGMKEVFLSDLALEKSTNAEVKSFAKHMVKDHRAANEKLAKIAQEAGLSFPPTNAFSADDPNWSNPLIANPESLKGAQLLTMTNLPYLLDYKAVLRLKSLDGGEFDGAYAGVMAGDHVQAVSEFETASQSLADPNLKKFADKTLPTLRKHSKMAQELNDKCNTLNGTTMTNAPGSMVTPVPPM